MADGISIKFNIPAFKAQLQELGFDMERKIIRSGVSAAANVFKKKVIELAPVQAKPKRGVVPGRLKKAIYTKRARDSKNGIEHYFVGVRQGQQAASRKGGNVNAYYWRWVEQGHRIIPRGAKITGGRRTKALKRSRFDASGGGRTKPAWFIRNAFNQVQPQALDAFNSKVQQRIDKANAK